MEMRSGSPMVAFSAGASSPGLQPSLIRDSCSSYGEPVWEFHELSGVLVISPSSKDLACAAAMAVCSALPIEEQGEATSIAVLRLRTGGPGLERSIDGMCSVEQGYDPYANRICTQSVAPLAAATIMGNSCPASRSWGSA